MRLVTHEQLAGVEFAEKISVVTCHDHHQVHLQLHRADGAIFAAGGLAPDEAARLGGSLIRAAAAARADSLEQA